MLVTISNGNDIKLIILSSLFTTILLLVFILIKNLRFIKQHQRDNELYMQKTIQQLNDKEPSDT